MKNRTLSLLPKAAGLLALGVLLSACASAPQHNPKLVQAQSAYQAASNNAKVAQAAPEQLQKASQALNKAQQMKKRGASKLDVDHYAYMASRHVAIANEAAREQAAEAKIKQASAERDRMKAQESQQQARESQQQAHMTREQNAQLQKQLAALKAKKTKRGLVLTLGNVLFALNKADLKPGGARTVSRLAEFMKQYPKRNVMIEGYTDSTGTAAYNQQLSQRRAAAVRDALVADGINPQRIVTKGFGEKYPVATNKTAAGRQQNRRVEIVISDENGDFNKGR